MAGQIAAEGLEGGFEVGHVSVGIHDACRRTLKDGAAG